MRERKAQRPYTLVCGEALGKKEGGAADRSTLSSAVQPSPQNDTVGQL